MASCRALHVRIDRRQGCVGVRDAGLHVRTATPLSAGESGKASGEGGAETETVSGRVVTGLMHIMAGLNTRGLRYEGGK